jgi:hypothetical protein
MSKAFAAIALFLPCLLLTQCDAAQKAARTAARNVIEKPNPENPAVAFDVAIEMTPAAAALLKTPGSGLVVDVAYYGYPTEAALPKVNNLKQIGLGRDVVTVAATSKKAHIPGGGLKQKDLSDVVDGSVMVLIDGYGFTSDTNTGEVRCGYYRDRLELARARAVIKCDIPTPN